MEERQSQYALEIITVHKEQYIKSPSGFEDSPLGAWISWEAIPQYGAPLRAHLWFGESNGQHEGSGLLAPLEFLPHRSTAARLFGLSSSNLKDNRHRIEPIGNHLYVYSWCRMCVILLSTDTLLDDVVVSSIEPFAH